MAKVQSSNFAWLLKLRWGAIAAQMVVFFSGDRLVHVSPPLLLLLVVIGLEAITNVACMIWARRVESVPEAALVALMTLDSLLLTALLYLAGGDSNPFAVLYLVNIALAGILLRPRWTWALTGLSLLCFGLLFGTRPATRNMGSDPVEWQLREMWLAFAVASGLIVYFVQRTTRMLRERERAAEAVRRAAEKQEKLASLATLATGAAHELATPLSTIALVAKELERQLERSQQLPGAIEDVRLIREEVERCRNIMSQMAVDAGEAAGEPMERLSIEAIVERVLAGAREKRRVRVVLEPGAGAQTLAVPPRAFAQAINALLKNALQASPDDSEVWLRIKADALTCRIEVADQGTGMTSEVLARAGEPFFTTKEPGRGMGLGLFLTRSLLEQLGGRLELGRAPERGTIATLVLPRARESSGLPQTS